MPKDERYLELYSKPVLATLSGTELKFIATYHHYEVEDDYDDNPRYYFYEIGPYPPIGDDSMLIYDTDISHMTLFDPETMGIERVEYDDMTEREQWLQYLKGCDEKTLKKIKQQNEFIRALDEKAEDYWIKEKRE